MTVSVVACTDGDTAGLPAEFAGPFESPNPTFEVGTAPSSSCVAGFTSDVLALDADTGEMAWTTPVPWIGDVDRVALAGDVLVGRSSADHDAAPYLFALDPATGRPYWQRNASRLTTGPPLAAFPNAVITSDGTDLVSYQARTGREQWRRALGPGGAWTSVPGGVVVASGETLALVEPTRGETRWETAEPRSATALRSHADLVLLSGPERSLVAVDVRTGQRRFQLPAAPDREYVVIDDRSESGVLYVGETAPRSATGRAADRPSDLHAVDPATGEIAWSQRLAAHPGAVVIHPPVVVDTAAAGTWTGLDRYAFGARWTFPLDVPHALVPFGDRRLLFVRNVVTGPGAAPPLRIEARSANDASVQWTYDLDAYHLGPVALHGETALVSGIHPRRINRTAPTASVLVALDVDDGTERWSTGERRGVQAATGLRWAGTLLVTRSDAPDSCP
ncbi:MAG: outer membrane protein assembly factor BamB family protein [Acidimicrobiales bacterium]